MDTQTPAFIGVDPGAKGAICIIIPDQGIIDFMPTILAPDKILAQLKLWKEYHTIPPIMMEHVSSIPGAAAGSNFKFGFNVGLLHGIIMSSMIGMDLVRPKVWQKEVGVPAKVKSGPELKKAVAEIANRLYPSAPLFGPKGGLLDGRSDALMLAHYARLTYKV